MSIDELAGTDRYLSIRRSSRLDGPEMLLTIRTTYRPAADLGFLLHKHSDHVHRREFPFGDATVFYCQPANMLGMNPGLGGLG